MRQFVFLLAFIVPAFASIAGGIPASAGDGTASDAAGLFSESPDERTAAIDRIAQRGDRGAIPALIDALRYNQYDRAELVDALRALSGEDAGETWFEWMEWQQARTDITPFAGYDSFKSAFYRQIDPAFGLFIHAGVAHEIRLEEIAWGGVPKDGIPALTNPRLASIEEADYLTGEELVFGVEINGDARAYPLRLMDWHEMFNDVIGGVPVSLAYCTLCGSGILFETSVEGRGRPFVFGSSGFLYRSNKLMYDDETHSLWNQFTGRPVVGPLTGSGIELKTLPVVIAKWADWLAAHPDTRVLSLNTGIWRDYAPGRAYGDYFASPDLMFPALVDETTLGAKDYVFALRGLAHEKAWPLSLFEDSPVVNDMAGVVPVTLIGNAKTRTVRAYRTAGETFEATEAADKLSAAGQLWTVTEDALIGPNGARHTRLPGHIAYWFAWSGYFGTDGEVAAGPR